MTHGVYIPGAGGFSDLTHGALETHYQFGRLVQEFGHFLLAGRETPVEKHISFISGVLVLSFSFFFLFFPFFLGFFFFFFFCISSCCMVAQKTQEQVGWKCSAVKCTLCPNTHCEVACFYFILSRADENHHSSRRRLLSALVMG